MSGNNELIRTLNVLELVRQERVRQDAKWGPVGTQQEILERWLVILGEEYGEACRCVLEINPRKKKITVDWIANLRRELVQVAAVAVAAMEWLDATEEET